LNEEEQRFVERMGRHFEAEGVPRIGGRLFGFLLLQEEPRSLDEMTEHLRVSKTSVSTNARLLDQLGLIQRVTRPGDRRDYYEVAPDQTRTLEFRLRHIREMGDLLANAAHGLSDRPFLERRLTLMRRYNAEALTLLEELLARWRAQKG
jgi:DNA-binding transcriptional regulator GbsR (MarR family)